MPSEVTIVMYHYIRKFSQTRYDQIKGLDYQGFIRQLDFLQKNYTIVTVDDVIQASRAGEPLAKNAALLTFDDGYAEHYQLVFPILFDRGIEGAFFPPVDPVRNGRLLDVNRLHFILANCDNPASLSKVIDDHVAALQKEEKIETVDAYRSKWAHANRFDDAETIYVKRMLQTALPEVVRNEIARNLFKSYVSVDEKAFAGELYITVEQAQTMNNCGMFFGSHGYSHYWLNNIDQPTQEREVDLAIEFLNEIGCDTKKYWAMCYPFGGWNEELLSVLKKRNCAIGFTTEVATADIGQHNLLTLPRYDTNDFPQ